jgi:hypothetical protein
MLNIQIERLALRRPTLPTAWRLQAAANAQLLLRPKLTRYKTLPQIVEALIVGSTAFIKKQLRDIRRVREADEKCLKLCDKVLAQDHPAGRAEFLARRSERYFRLIRGNGNPWRDGAAA